MGHPCTQEERFDSIEERNTSVSKDIKWLIKIGYGVFLVGLAVFALGITSLFYAGGLWKAVEMNTRNIEKIERKIERTENYLWGERR